LDGTKTIVCRHRGPVTTPELLGQELADQMIAKGARAVLEDEYRAQTVPEPHS
jgi:porphobilinogen deaminase